MSEVEFTKEIEEQTFTYLDLCAMYEKTPSVLGFSQHLHEAYETRDA
jgi:hypothetical protein